MIIAHRGASCDAPENTISAIKLALKQEADAIEVDIHLTKDKKIVVIHDPSTLRTSGVTRIIADSNFNELKKLDFGLWKGEKWRNEKLPLLEDVLNIIPADYYLFIEIKSSAEILVHLKKIFYSNNINKSKLFLMSFDLEVMQDAKSLFKDIKTLLLLEFPVTTSPNQRKQILQQVILTARKNNFDGVDIENIPELDKEFISECKKNGLKCFCWTVNDPTRAEYLLKNGIDGITTDKPGYIIEKLKR